MPSNIKDSPFSTRRRHALCCTAFLLLAPIAAWSAAFDDYFRAVKLDDVKTVQSLLQRGFDPNTIEAERNDTGLILALRENAMKVFKLLVDAPGIDLEARSRNGDTALMIAAYRGNVPAVDALLERNAEVNRPGWTALHYAAAIGNNEVIKRLLERSAYIDAESPNGTTPLMMAARTGHIYAVKLLLDEGADATLRNALGMTATELARKNNHRDIAEGLEHRMSKNTRR